MLAPMLTTCHACIMTNTEHHHTTADRLRVGDLLPHEAVASLDSYSMPVLDTSGDLARITAVEDVDDGQARGITLEGGHVVYVPATWRIPMVREL